ncbi:sugar ABC transporter permease [Firmicutes bacterium AF22-6AC]|jgi:multiple sugar transport system permease protein|nr:sugar ABC transporter permease [Firmicutes bacterium AF22-6AC]
MRNLSVKTKQGHKKRPDAFFLLLPVILLLLLFIAYPLVNTVALAFQDYRLTSVQSAKFNGLANFKAIVTDPYFGLILRNSLIFTFVTVLLQFFLGLVLALALNKPFRGRNIYQAIVFLPWSISALVIGFTFRWLYNAEFGPVNDLLIKLGILKEKVSFLGDGRLALLCVISAMVWYGVPFFGIMLTAAFQSIPTDLYEAAEIDGSGAVKKFWYITLPYAKPTIILTLLLRTIWIFNSADLIYVMTNGGPANATHTLASYMFSKAYSTLDFGQTGALGVLFMAGLLLYAGAFMKLTKYDGSGGF